MRIDVRVSVPKLWPVLPTDMTALKARLRAVREMVGVAPLPRTSRLREAAVALASAEAERRGERSERT